MSILISYLDIVIFWPLNFLFFGTLFIGMFVPILGSRHIQNEIRRFIPKFTISVIILNSVFFIRTVFIRFPGLVKIDDIIFWCFFVIILSLMAVIFFFARDRFVLYTNNRLEFSFLFIFFHLGSIIVIKINNFGAIFLGLERVTLVGYIIIISERKSRFSNYAGIQYFIIGSFPSAMLVLAFGLFYMQSGAAWFGDLELIFNTITSGFSSKVTDLIRTDYTTINVNNVFLYIETPNVTNLEQFFIYDSIVDFFFTTPKVVFTRTAITIIAFIALLFNFFFKMAAAPFHVWAPSVYRNSAIIAVTFLSIFAKLTIFFLIIKVTHSFIINYININFFIFLFVGLLSVITGIFMIFSEKNTKLFFVYSSIGHVGYILIGLSLNTRQSITGAVIYIIIYCISAFIRWFTLISIGRETIIISSFSNLKKNNVELALIFAFLMFSISGIPPFAGFFIKLDIIAAVMNASLFSVLYFIFITTIAVFFYYLRIIKIIYYDTTKIEQENTYITYDNHYKQEYIYNNHINWIIIIIVRILTFYPIIIHKRFTVILIEIISTWFLFINIILKAYSSVG